MVGGDDQGPNAHRPMGLEKSSSRRWKEVVACYWARWAISRSDAGSILAIGIRRGTLQLPITASWQERQVYDRG